MSLPDVMERLCAWLISFGCQFTGPDLVKVELSGLPVSLVWDEDRGELSLVSIDKASPLVIRSSSKLEHVCLCLALAQAASITRGEAQ